MAGPALDPVLAAKEREVFLSKDASRYADAVVERVTKERTPCTLALPTGSGKSTVIVYAFIQAGNRVTLAQPTVAMCSNVVRSFHDMFPSIVVGRAYGRETNIPKDARLVVTTNGNLKKRMLGAIKTGGTCVSIDWTDITVVDEAHFGSLDAHIIVTLWYFCSQKFASTARMPRLLLSSATASDILFSRRFSPCVYLPPEELTRTPYLITPQWSEKDYGMQDASRFKAMGELLKSLHESRPVAERILVFLPGKLEMTNTLAASGLKPDVDITLLTIWSESSPEDFAPIGRSEDPLRLVVFATPSADAGLTIVRLFHVIDSLLVKNSHTQSNGSQALITEVASRQLSKQRMGRVGRTAPGFYYPMCTEQFYKSDSMPATYTLEINRVPLYTDIVELTSHGVPVEEVFAIYNVPSLAPSIEQLLQWGLLHRSPTSGELFPSSGGSFMTLTDVASPRLAGVLYAWVRMGQPVTEGVVLLHLIATMTSQVLQIPDSFETNPGDPRGKTEQLRTNFMRRKFGRFVGPSDIHTAIRLWNLLIVETAASDEPGKPGEGAERWCIANSIKWRTIKNIIKSIQKTAPRIVREAARLIAREAAQSGKDITAELDSKSDSLENSKSWIVNEARSLPVLRRLMEHVYQDLIGTRKADGRVVYVMKDSSTIEPEKTKGFTLQSDPESATPYPMRVVIIGQQTKSKGNLVLTQFLDIDDPSTIAKISTDELNERLGIFMNVGARRTGSRRRRG